MSKDADDGEDHAGEITICVAHEDAGGVPVVHPQREGDANEWKEEEEREEMGVRCWVRISCENV